ncbi:MAG TPA: response regulator transcription factor [Saprospiraceae bacterium]|nr:response regulator transcription factor [Saprospiraceae bacterium]
MIKVLIVDDHPMILEGLRTLLREANDINITGLCANAIEAMSSIKHSLPDVALLDINLPDINGIELCEKIKKEFPSIQTIAITTFSERSYIQKMLQAGASGYLIKSSTKEEIINAIHQVHKGGMYMNVSFDTTNEKEKNIQPTPFLTPREKEILLLIAEGLTNPQIAEQLFVSVLTVNSHRKNLLSKFDVHNTASLIKIAAQMNLI